MRGGSQDGISALIRRDQMVISLSLPHVRTQQEVAICKAGPGLSAGTESAGTLCLDSPAFITGRNKLLSFEPPNQWYFVTAARTD